jgi:hypothetical protein
MRTVMAFGQKESGTSQGQEDEAPSRLTTTLYDLMTVIQAVVGPDDTQVVRTVVHLLRSGQLTYPGKERTRRRSTHCDKLSETYRAFHYQADALHARTQRSMRVPPGTVPAEVTRAGDVT